MFTCPGVVTEGDTAAGVLDKADVTGDTEVLLIELEGEITISLWAV